MVQINVIYEGDLHCRVTHGPSGAVLATDAPKDNMGKGESFSPTDLLAASLGSCMMTLMGIYAARHAINLKGTTVEVQKEMATEPRRVGKLTVIIQMPGKIDKTQRAALEKAALTCPVHKSLHPDTQIPVSFQYPD
jgi:uncharacterized OsmC-like protein